MTEKHNQDGSISQNWLAEEITKREEGKIETNIAQVKEILKDTLEILHTLQKDELDELLSRH
jgi:hypothetical protein